MLQVTPYQRPDSGQAKLLRLLICQAESGTGFTAIITEPIPK